MGFGFFERNDIFVQYGHTIFVGCFSVFADRADTMLLTSNTVSIIAHSVARVFDTFPVISDTMSLSNDTLKMFPDNMSRAFEAMPMLSETIPMTAETLTWAHAAALAVSTVFLLVASRRRRDTWPMAPGNLPLIGHALDLADSDESVTVIKKWVATVGQKEGIFEFRLFGQRWVVCCSTETVMAAFKLRSTKFIRSKILTRSIDSLKATGVFTSEGDQWRKERRIVGPALNQQHVKDFHPSIQTVSQRLVEKWTNIMNKDESVPAANHDITAAALDIVALTILGIDLNTLSHAETQLAKDMLEFFRIIIVRTLAPIQYWKIPIIGPNLDGFRDGNKRIVDTLTRKVQEYRESKAKAEASKNDEDKNQIFLEKIIDISESEKVKFSDKELVGNLLTMFAAGTDTTSNTISTAVWHLANDLELQDDLYQEVVDYLQESNKLPGDLTLEECLDCFPRLRSFLFEILRLKGPTPNNFLEPAEKMEFLGKTIDRGTIVFIVGTSYPFDKNTQSEVPLGPNGEPPQEFCARRWLSTESSASDEEKKDDIIRRPKLIFPSNREGGFMAFGHGLRACPGRKYAEGEMTTMMIHLLYNFSFNPAKDCPPLRLVTRFTETLDKEMKLNLRPRKALEVFDDADSLVDETRN